MQRLAAAYDSADKKDFYEFTLALDALKQSLTGSEKTIILDADSDLAKILVGAQGQ
jgi:membrane protease subunit HflC